MSKQALEYYDPDLHNAAALLVTKVAGEYVVFSKRYELAARVLDVIEEGLAHG